MPMALHMGMEAGHPVKVFDAVTGALVGEFESMSQAGNRLFIKHGCSKINAYLNGRPNMKFNKKQRGVKSYKTGIRYHFEKI